MTCLESQIVRIPELEKEIEFEKVGFLIASRPYHVGKLSQFWKSTNHTSNIGDFLH